MINEELTPHGRLLEEARGSMSKREAARRADISEGRWRQVVNGFQKAGDLRIPVNPRPETLIAMAGAVGADKQEVLSAAGLTPVGRVLVDVFAPTGEDDGPMENLLRARDLLNLSIKQLEAAQHEEVQEPVEGQGSASSGGEGGQPPKTQGSSERRPDPVKRSEEVQPTARGQEDITRAKALKAQSAEKTSK